MGKSDNWGGENMLYKLEVMVTGQSRTMEIRDWNRRGAGAGSRIL